MSPVAAAASTHRRQIAALKRQMSTLERELAKLRKAVVNSAPEAAAEEGQKPRFVAKGLKSLRSRLGLSAREFAQLVGVSEQTIYNWETKKATPRASQLTTLASLRGIGKREAQARLASSDAAPAATTRRRRTKAAE